MIRVAVQTSDAGMAVNVVGHVQMEVKTFDIEAPELERYLRDYEDARKRGEATYWSRCVTGIEILPEVPA